MDRNRKGKSLACPKWRSSIIRNSCAGVSFSCAGWAGRSSPNSQKVCPSLSPYSQNSDSITERKHPVSVEVPTRGFWQPFLQQIQTLHPVFSSVLVRTLIARLTLIGNKVQQVNNPKGRFLCFADWSVCGS